MCVCIWHNKRRLEITMCCKLYLIVSWTTHSDYGGRSHAQRQGKTHCILPGNKSPLQYDARYNLEIHNIVELCSLGTAAQEMKEKVFNKKKLN